MRVVNLFVFSSYCSLFLICLPLGFLFFFFFFFFLRHSDLAPTAPTSPITPGQHQRRQAARWHATAPAASSKITPLSFPGGAGHGAHMSHPVVTEHATLGSGSHQTVDRSTARRPRQVAPTVAKADDAAPASPPPAEVPQRPTIQQVLLLLV